MSRFRCVGENFHLSCLTFLPRSVQVSGPGSEEEEELDGDPPGLRALAPAGPPEGSSEEEDGRAEDEGRRRGQASPDRMALGYEGLLDAYRKEVDLNHSLHARLQAVHGRVKVLCVAVFILDSEAGAAVEVGDAAAFPEVFGAVGGQHNDHVDIRWATHCRQRWSRFHRGRRHRRLALLFSVRRKFQNR